MKLLGNLKQEFKSLELIFVYFLTWFSLGSFLEKLALREYSISFYGFSKAVILALIVAKIVLVLDRLPWDKALLDSRLYVDILFRSIVYSLGTIALFGAEKLVHLTHQTGTVHLALTTFWKVELYQFLAVFIWVMLAFLVYNLISVISLRIGKDELTRLYFATSRKQLIMNMSLNEMSLNEENE